MSGTTVTTIHLGFTDADMVAAIDSPENDPRDVARLAVQRIIDGAYEVLADDTTRYVKQQLTVSPIGLVL